MPKTAVGSFENQAIADVVVREIEALGIPRREISTLQEPKDMAVTGIMSFPRLDFEVHLKRELTRIGATTEDAEFYVNGLRRGRALVFASGPNSKVDAAAEIMNRHSGRDVTETTGAALKLPLMGEEEQEPVFASGGQAGRVREQGEGPRFFVW